jgi:hypothetical protein
MFFFKSPRAPLLCYLLVAYAKPASEMRASPLLKDILKHFAVNTIPTFSSGIESQVAWRAVLPILAGKYRFVTHGMLAVASLHLAYLAGTEHERSVYQDIAAAQMNEGTHGYRSEVKEVTIENAEALFAFSTTMTVFVLSTATAECELVLKGIRTGDKVPDQQAVSTSSLVQLICRIFHSIRGALVILVPCWSHLCRGTLRPIVERSWWPVASPMTPGELCDHQRLHHLETMWSRPGRAYEYSFDTLRFALRILCDSFVLVSRLESLAQPCEEAGGQPFDWTSALHWPTQITREFLALLEDECMEAWVLVAHFAMLPAKIEGIVWLDGFATNTIKSAALVIGEENWNWLAWPAGAARVDLESVRGLSTIRQSNHTGRPASVSQLPPFSATYGAFAYGIEATAP